jgi:hypothetical protein
MPIDARWILQQLDTVRAERERRRAAPRLSASVEHVKHYQQRRFSHTYSDLLGSPRYGAAARFFLDELYGPRDFTQRDEQFGRVVPALVRLFPQEIVDTVGALAELHAMSEALDTLMGIHTNAEEPLDGVAYIKAWQATGSAAQRQQQITLTLEVGQALDRLTRNALIRNSMRMMRVPARAAGLGELQKFLEAGFETFRAMHGADEFLSTVRRREQQLNAALFAASFDPNSAARSSLELALGQLP